MQNTMPKNNEQMQLVEKYGIKLEESLKLSPLAARIYTILILSSDEGLTFDEIKTIIKASKSSISININVLLQLDYINFYTKTGDRKRYFKISKYSSLTTLEYYLQEINKEIELIKEINSYNKKYHLDKYTNDVSLGEIFENYLQKKQKLVEETVKEMIDFRNQEK